jgi:hypothetical protein
MVTIKQKKINADYQFTKDAMRVCARLPAVVIILVAVYKIEHFIVQILHIFPHFAKHYKKHQMTKKCERSLISFSNFLNLRQDDCAITFVAVKYQVIRRRKIAWLSEIGNFFNLCQYTAR